jgi:hypothetical protein
MPSPPGNARLREPSERLVRDALGELAHAATAPKARPLPAPWQCRPRSSSDPITASSSNPANNTPTARDDRFRIHVAMLELDDESNNAPPGKHVTGQAHNTAPPNGDGPACSPVSVTRRSQTSLSQKPREGRRA